MDVKIEVDGTKDDDNMHVLCDLTVFGDNGDNLKVNGEKPRRNSIVCLAITNLENEEVKIQKR